LLFDAKVSFSVASAACNVGETIRCTFGSLGSAELRRSLNGSETSATFATITVGPEESPSFLPSTVKVHPAPALLTFSANLNAAEKFFSGENNLDRLCNRQFCSLLGFIPTFRSPRFRRLQRSPNSFDTSAYLANITVGPGESPSSLPSTMNFHPVPAFLTFFACLNAAPNSWPGDNSLDRLRSSADEP
jgi:hypothetical protein